MSENNVIKNNLSPREQAIAAGIIKVKTPKNETEARLAEINERHAQRAPKKGPAQKWRGAKADFGTPSPGQTMWEKNRKDALDKVAAEKQRRADAKKALDEKKAADLAKSKENAKKGPSPKKAERLEYERALAAKKKADQEAQGRYTGERKASAQQVTSKGKTKGKK